MRTYVAFGLKSFTASLAYRSEVWLQTFGNFVTVLIQVAIWSAVIGSGLTEGVSLDQMITYSILSMALGAILLDNVGDTVSGSLQSGSIAAQLIRPMSYPLYLLADALGGACYRLAFIVAPSILISGFTFGLQGPASAAHGAAFVLSLLLALAVSFLLGYLIALVAFWTLTHFALDFTLGGLMIVFSGSFLPLWFFPEPWRSVALALPFQYAGYVPGAVYLGVVPEGELAGTLLLGAGWAAALLAVNLLLWRLAVRRLVIQGG